MKVYFIRRRASDIITMCEFSASFATGLLTTSIMSRSRMGQEVQMLVRDVDTPHPIPFGIGEALFETFRSAPANPPQSHNTSHIDCCRCRLALILKYCSFFIYLFLTLLPTLSVICRQVSGTQRFFTCFLSLEVQCNSKRGRFGVSQLSC